ncbi:hypothetical protein AAFF_G00079170 [Aldrovandia affinis]|uniref:Ig-like domain-containing protein n=1 Tax=Aldrovandia affinis TaxID=143900 RepID=A0AAD7WCG5_9TELE|nr:hypothetical protein AAFF_G00079170 [Aldrovandia affinis]
MVVLFLQLLGFVLNVWAQSFGDADVEMEVGQNVTGVLGEDVVLRCLYKGQEDLLMSSWTQKEGHKSRRLAGHLQLKPFVLNKDFSEPGSPSNLTVRMQVTSLEAEREYTCTFYTMEGSVEKSVFLTVLARPEVHVYTEEREENGTHFQTVTCSALSGKPAATIVWLINGSRADDGGFSVVEATQRNPNGTTTRTSVLRFPTHLQDAGEVTCSVAHPALPEPLQETVRVRTFVAPTVTLEIQNGKEGVELTCVAMGGRPAPNITWLLPGDTSEGPPENRVWWDEEADTTRATSSLQLQVHPYEGENITCLIAHPKFPRKLMRTIMMPTYELSSVRAVREEHAQMGPENEIEGQVVLEEGQKNVAIRVEATGNVPHYQVHCTRENGSLPAGVEVAGNVLQLEGPVDSHHAGLYTCQASYYGHTLSVTLEIVVNPIVVQPVVILPSVKIRTWEDVDHRMVECSASDAFPAANVSWSLPVGLSGTIHSNSTSQNGTHSVVSALRLPACLSLEHTVECAIEHSGLMEPETRLIKLPVCERPNITIHSSTVWDEGTEITEVECAVDGGKHRAAIVWRVEGGDGDRGASELTESLTGNQASGDGSGMVRSLVRLPTLVYAGRVIACVVEHPALEAPEIQKIWVTLAEIGSSLVPPSPSPVPPVLGVSLRQQEASALWLAVCDFRGAAGSINITWVLPENSTGRMAFRSGQEGGRLWANSTYEFPLARHGGENLSCLIQDEHSTEERILHIPQFYISSLRANLPGQKILLKVYGNAPQYNLTCTRSDGSAVRTVGGVVAFPPEVSEKDEGLYICRASFDVHSATVLIQVEVTSDNIEHWMLAAICFSTAAAITLILVVCLCVFCKRNGDDPSRSEASHNKRDSLAALTSLMQDPCSPELKKSDVARRTCQEYAELVRYSIVIDVKTTV